MTYRMSRVPLLIALLIALLATTGLPAAAQSPTKEAASLQDEQGSLIRVTAHDGVTTLSFGGDAAAAATPANWPTFSFAGYSLPGYTVLLRATGAASAAGAESVQVQRLSAVPWSGEVLPTAAPPALPSPENPYVRPQSDRPTLPASPVFVLAQGEQRGVPVIAYGVSPLYQENGETKFATDLEVTISGAVPLDEAPFSVEEGAWAAQVDQAASLHAPAPRNSAATQDAYKLVVSEPGMQSVPLSDLRELGFDSRANDLKLTYQGQPVAFEIEGGALRFFAPNTGNLLNPKEVYWLTADGGGARIATRSAAHSGATVSDIAFEKGLWIANTAPVYVSVAPGVDGDHYFAHNLRWNPEQPSVKPAAGATWNTRLPAAAGPQPSTIQVNLATDLDVSDEYTVRAVVTGDSAAKTFSHSTYDSGSGQAAPTATWTFATSASSSPMQLSLTLEQGLETQPGGSPGLLLDTVSWMQTVRLNFGGAGGPFSALTSGGPYAYRLTNRPAGARLYNVSNPRQPVALTFSGDVFQDAAGGDYWLAGQELPKPAVTRHRAVTFRTNDSAHVIYIAPQPFHEALQPLKTQRERQGYIVKIVDIQAIYDAWSYGMVSPSAVRDFLGFAYTNWRNSTGAVQPVAAVLVGDGTRDPRNYEQKNNQNFIPPYLAEVDHKLLQTACERCFGQLNGEDPLAAEPFLFAELQIGRFPVNSAAELSAVVGKIIQYENAPGIYGWWRHKVALLTDDYRRTDGTVDPAGNFALHSEELVSMMPKGMLPNRLYYGRYQAEDFDRSFNRDWLEEDADALRARLLSDVKSGGGLLIYNGHANHWNWASTTNGNHLFTTNDVLDSMNNGERQFVGLSMTCYTSQFQQPAAGGTIDELMFRKAGGGAVAVWGPAGLTVAQGHDALQKGFTRALWAASPTALPTMGALVEAGYAELKGEHPDIVATFVLMGDPLTRVRVLPAGGLTYLPSVILSSER